MTCYFFRPIAPKPRLPPKPKPRSQKTAEEEEQTQETEVDNSETTLKQLRDKNQTLRLELEARGEQLGDVSWRNVCVSFWNV